MSYLVYALGAFLSLCGAIAFYSGYGIIEVERGWAMVIAGSVAFSAGLVIIVLGLILRELSRLEASKEPGWQLAERPHQTFGGNRREGALSPPEVFGQGSDAASSISPAAAGRGWPLRPTRSGLSATRNLLKTRGAVSPSQRNPADSDTNLPNFPFSARDTGAPSDRLPFESVLGRPSGPRATQKDLREEQPPADLDEDFFEEPAERAIEEFPVEPLEVKPAHRSQPLAEPFTEPNLDTPQAAASPAQNFEEELFIELRRARGPVLLHSNLPPLDQTDENEKPEIMQEGKGALPPLSSNTQELAVVGQYETRGTSYVMYSDGSVEARTEHAVFHFKSMAELKTFLESDGRLPQE